jgi:hypothetical protein
VGCYCDFLDIFFTLGDVLSPLLFNYYSCFVDYFYLLSRLLLLLLDAHAVASVV